MSKNILVFALSACIHCRHCKEYLNEKGITYEVTYVDKLDKGEQAAALDEMRKYNPACSFPTVIINDGEKVLIGFSKKRFDEEFDNVE